MRVEILFEVITQLSRLRQPIASSGLLRLHLKLQMADVAKAQPDLSPGQT